MASYFYFYKLSERYRWFYKCQFSTLLPEGKCTIKKQLYSGPFTLREAAFYLSALIGFDVALLCLYFSSQLH